MQTPSKEQSVVKAHTGHTAMLSFEEMQSAAAVMAKSGLFPQWNTAEKMLSLMLLCRSEGIDPIRAVNRYDNVQGRICKRAEAKLEDFICAGGKVEWLELSDKCARAKFSPPNGNPPLEYQYDWQDVIRANNQGKDNYKKYPKDMLRSRLVSAALRMVWPQAGSLMYSPEEAMDIPVAGQREINVTPPGMFAHEQAADAPVADPPPPRKRNKPAEANPDVSVLTPDGVVDVEPIIAPPKSEEKHPIYGLPEDKTVAFLRKIKWLKAGQGLADLSDAQFKQIEDGFEKFRAKVEAL